MIEKNRFVIACRSFLRGGFHTISTNLAECGSLQLMQQVRMSGVFVLNGLRRRNYKPLKRLVPQMPYAIDIIAPIMISTRYEALLTLKKRAVRIESTMYSVTFDDADKTKKTSKNAMNAAPNEYRAGAEKNAEVPTDTYPMNWCLFLLM